MAPTTLSRDDTIPREGTVRCLVLVSVILAVPMNPATAYRIGLFTDSTATNCSLQLGEPVSANYMWVVVFLDNEPNRRIVGAEFSLRGFPDDWFIDVNALAYPARWLLSQREMVLAYYEPPTVSGGILPLFQILILAYSQVGPTRVWVDRRSPPTNPAYAGPVLIVEEPPLGNCDGGSPRYEAIPMAGLSAMVNGPCTLGVESAAWTRIKLLYH